MWYKSKCGPVTGNSVAEAVLTQTPQQATFQGMQQVDETVLIGIEARPEFQHYSLPVPSLGGAGTVTSS